MHFLLSVCTPLCVRAAAVTRRARPQVSDASVFPYSAVGQLLGQIGNTNTCAPVAARARGAARRQSHSCLPASSSAMWWLPEAGGGPPALTHSLWAMRLLWSGMSMGLPRPGMHCSAWECEQHCGK